MSGFFGTTAGVSAVWFVALLALAAIARHTLAGTRKRLELAQRELRKAREAAEAETQAKSRFLAEMSHEIRSPMNSIIGVLDLLQNSPLNQEQARYLHLAQASASALLALVNDILDLSKIESGRLNLSIVPVDLPGLLEQLVQLFTDRAGKKGLSLTYRVASGIPEMICADPLRLRQVLVNLLDNAIKFTDTGEIELHVVARGVEDDPCQLRFEVTDTGKGIPASLQAEIFTAYVQAEESGARKQEGAGLGLFISRRMVELMGGKIGFTSTPGKGSMFWFTAAFSKAEISPSAAPMPETVPAPPWGTAMAGSGLCKYRVLVADDSEMNRIPCSEMLKKLGVDVVTVNDGLQALEAVANMHFDLVLMDCRMPVMDGYEASRRIRAMEQQQGRGRTPIIALTAYAMEGDREASLAAGMDDHLAKPFKFAQLQSLLKTWLTSGPEDTGKQGPRTRAGSAHLPFYR